MLRAPRLLALAPLALSACFLFDGPDTPSSTPQGGPFALDPSCQLAGALGLELGDGTDGFTPLADGAGPQLHFGAQGGVHIWAAARVGGLDPARSDRVRVTLGLFAADACPTLGEACDGEPQYGRGQWVFTEVDEPTVEEDRLQIVLDTAPADVVLQAVAEDECGRVGLVQHDIAQL